MKKKIHEYSKILTLIILVLGVAAIDTYGMPFTFRSKRIIQTSQIPQTNTPTTNGEPVVKTESTPHSNFTSVTFPQNYSGEVTTTCEGTVCKTNTRTYTKEELQKIEQDMRAREKAMQEYIQAQQEFFDSVWKGRQVPFPRFPF